MIKDFILDESDLSIAKMFGIGIRPVPRITVSEWSNTKRILTSTSSSEVGKWRTNRVPYLRLPMDLLGKTSDVQKVICMKGAQLGWTELGNNWIGYTMDLDPGPILLVMPTDAAVKKNSTTRIAPMIKNTPALNEKVKASGSKEAGNTVFNKEFPGGVLMMVGANSPVGLSSTPVAKVFLDEVDRYPQSAGEEGSPIELAIARTRTFPNKKIFIISTPTIEGESVISAEFDTTDKNYYNVPCKHCGDLFIITFDLLTYNEESPGVVEVGSVKCACPNCGGLHDERDKTTMLAEEGFGGRAKWISTRKSDDPRTVGFHISSLYSPAGWYSWEECIRDYLKIKGDVEKEKTFANTVLGETHKNKGEVPDYENLYNRREHYPIGCVPEGVYFLTMGVDIQRDRIECDVVGWGIGRETWDIQYSVLIGDTAKDDVWNQLKEMVNKHFEHADGSLMPIRFTCVDAGFNTQKVYDFCNDMGHSRVVPIQGQSNLNVIVSSPKVINVSKAGKKIGSAKVWGVGVSLLKSELYGFLKLQAIEGEDGKPDTYPPGYCHFPQYDRDYFKMLTSEQNQMVKNKKTGKVSYQWVKKQERNEVLDIRCYARAAAFIIGIDRFKDGNWEKIKESSRVLAKPKEVVVKKTVKKKSDFWKR
jgi:phage terminase large subunit GpA-like protein